MIGILILVLIIVIAGLVYVSLREDRGRDPLQERLAQFGERELPETLEDIELSLPFRDRVILPMMARLANLTTKFTPQKQLENTRHQLELAGQTTDPTTFLATRIITTIALSLGGVLLGFVILREDFSTAIMYTIGGAALGFWIQPMLLRSKIRKRQDNILKALPDALDLLVICVEAGLGFDAAMGKVFEKWDNELALAFGRVLREIQLGKTRKTSLKDMANRMDVPDVNNFVAAIIQADQLGVSMANILRVQADQMRTKRRQRAQEKAQQAPVKMMIPMVLLIFPSIWIVLLGPSILILMSTAGNGVF